LLACALKLFNCAPTSASNSGQQYESKRRLMSIQQQ